MILGLISAVFFFAAALPEATSSSGTPVTPHVPEAVFQVYREFPKTEIEVAWRGSRLILTRQYDSALKLLKEYQEVSPRSLLPSMGIMLIYQVQMIENFDFRFLKEFEAAQGENQRIMKRYFNEDRADRWQFFVAGASLGLQGLIHARKKQYLKAASLGWDGVGYMFKAEEGRGESQDFYDIYYGIGIYHYWVSWAQKKSLVLAFFPDRREQGMKELALCADRAMITSPMAAFSLAYLKGIEGKTKVALARLIPLYHSYPESVIVRSLLGRLLIADGQVDRGIEILETIRSEEPQLVYLNFHLARALYYRQRDPERVRKLLEEFVSQKGVTWPDVYFSKSHLYLSEIYATKRQWDTTRQTLKRVEKSHLDDLEKTRYKKMKKAFLD